MSNFSKVKLFFFSVIFLAFSLVIYLGRQNLAKPAKAQSNISYGSTNENFLNPERGFYCRVSLSPSQNYSGLRSEGCTLAHAYIRLDDYRYSDIPSSFLNNLNESFERLREARIKAIIRFAYNHSQTDDAPKEWILRHLDQLRPILANNADVIAAMEAGFIGAWGEWHSSTNGLENPQDRKDILFKILEALPSNRMALLRCPRYKWGIFGQRLTASQAFLGTNNARTGHHNDCFLSSEDNSGTYWGDNYNQSVEYWKTYIADEGQFTPVGGETCRESEYSHCSYALADLERLHWSYLNSGFHAGVLQIFKDEGCYEEIERRLGYRFVLDNLSVSSQVNPGGTMAFRLTLHNEGYASPFNQRPVFLVLENKSSSVKKTLSLVSGANPHSTDPRWWQSDQTVVIDENITLPQDLPQGTYNLYLWLPDAYENLRSYPEYSIRFANANVWQSGTGYNLLFDNLQVSGSSNPSPTPTPWLSPTPTPTPTPVPFPLRVNSAGGEYTDTKGNLWQADRAYSSGNWGYVGGNTVNRWDSNPSLDIEGTEDDYLYVTERWDLSNYLFDLPNGTYDVVLHFAETNFTTPGQRVFDVAIEGQTILDDFDPYVEAGLNQAIVKPIPNIAVTDGQLNISFIPNVENPEINAIEILPVGSIQVLSPGWNEVVWPEISGIKASDVPDACPMAVSKENLWFRSYVKGFGGIDFGFEKDKIYWLKCSQETQWQI